MAAMSATADVLTHDDPNAYVDDVVRRSGTSFFWAMRLLPGDKRRAMFAIYAFCREVDDIADEDGEADSKRQRLERWRTEIADLFEGRAGHSITRALAGPMRAFGLAREDFEAIIDGMTMDAADRVRIADMAELELYCDRVACAVGRLCNRVFGLDDPIGADLARSLGQALQLTNILRDLDEDAERDRLYLPLSLLEESDVSVHGATAFILTQPGVDTVCRRLAALAGQRFEEAETVLTGCDRNQVRPAIVMKEVYRRVLRRLLDRGWRTRGARVSVPRWQKLWIAVRHGIL